MPQPSDLLGLGMPAQLAEILGNAPQALTATGTTQADAAQIRSHLVEMTATGADGILLQAGVKIGTPVYVFNSSASTGLVYVPSGHTLNTTLNGSLSLVTHKGAFLIQYKRNFWMSVLTA